MESPVNNTDKEIWRETPGDYYAPSLFVTQEGAIGIEVAGLCFVKPIREWHKLAKQIEGYEPGPIEPKEAP